MLPYSCREERRTMHFLRCSLSVRINGDGTKNSTNIGMSKFVSSDEYNRSGDQYQLIMFSIKHENALFQVLKDRQQ
jgi:hypothetical protein